MGHNDLGLHHLATGNLNEALKCFIRTRDYGTTARHTVCVFLAYYNGCIVVGAMPAATAHGPHGVCVGGVYTRVPMGAMSATAHTVCVRAVYTVWAVCTRERPSARCLPVRCCFGVWAVCLGGTPAAPSTRLDAAR